ncbi:YbaB/EbfC family nucleoid-associated protein [Amycolatopsis thermophila]|uniref:DNA-binding protein YbaB n=1 Tax=Amycolatopsis thermophila TaxID=206084 RepID=A0ABU0ELH8_9PSEU|nr:YbaB/EbfC family nucleoid-associated protein [Amycolatopsis thermophila]MDQ0376143.1 DNA-binding protein YbaB [Amycolatopsis thermophila]
MDFPSGRVNPALASMLEQIKKATEELPKTSARMMKLTGVGWSPDRMVKVVVGPRGQLADLEIDPRVFRKPDAAALKAAIMAASRDAIVDVNTQRQEIMSSQFPSDTFQLQHELRENTSDTISGLMNRLDADIYAEREDER